MASPGSHINEETSGDNAPKNANYNNGRSRVKLPLRAKKTPIASNAYTL